MLLISQAFAPDSIFGMDKREWRLRWAEKAGTGFTLPSHQQAAAQTPNGKSGKVLEFRKVG
jgi:hypothetical protein